MLGSVPRALWVFDPHSLIIDKETEVQRNQMLSLLDDKAGSQTLPQSSPLQG